MPLTSTSPASPTAPENRVLLLEQKLQELIEHHTKSHPSCEWASDAQVTCSQDSRAEYEEHELKVLMWKPSLNATHKDRAWESTVKKLISRTPIATSWQQTVDELQLNQFTDDCIAATATTPLLPGNSYTLVIHGSQILSSCVETPLSLLQSYTRTAVLREKSAGSFIRLINFQKFIVICACAVLHKLENQLTDDLVEVTRMCIGNVSSKYAKSLWRTVIILNEIIDALHSNGWGDRASQLLLIWNEAPAFYYPFTTSPEAVSDMMKAKLSSDVYVSGVQIPERWSTLFVPQIVCQILKSQYDLAQVSHILGYQRSGIAIEEYRLSRMGREPYAKATDSWETQPHIHGKKVYARSVALRARGCISESDRIISNFLNCQTFCADAEFRRILGLLYLSQAYNRIYHFDFPKAREMSCKWRPSNDNLSNLEVHLLCDQLRTTGRILKGQGYFDEARCCFEGCLSTPELSQPKRTLVVCHLSDVYCELEYLKQIRDSTSRPPLQYLNQGRELLQLEIDRERIDNQHTQGYRRLLLSLTEIEIRQGCLDKAGCLVRELLGIYETIIEPDINDKVGHVRTLIAKARISGLHEAGDNWTAALLQNKKYNPFEEEVFTCGVIYLFLSLIRFQSGGIEASMDMLQKAGDVIRRKRPQFLMPGLGTYLFDFVTSELELVAGFVLPQISQ